MIDCHSHLLPGIDDGSRSIEESMEILEAFKAVGIQEILATPHFYPDDEVGAFVERREKAYETLKLAIGEWDLPHIRKGAEVLLSVDTPDLPDLEALCIEGTRYILIELPYVNWSEWVYEALYKIIAYRNLIPLIAHVERYEGIVSDISKINRLAEMDVVLQMNAYSLVGKKASFALKLIKHHIVHVLGSDVHRAKRGTSIAEGYEVIEKKLGRDTVLRLEQYATALIQNENIDKPEIKPIKKVLCFYI